LNSTTVLCGSGNDAIGGGMGSDYFDGGSGRDLLIGDVHGGTGNDTILGGLGDDLIIGGAGANQIDGGAGSDLIIAGSIQQSIYFEGESGPSGIFQIYQVWLSDDPVDDRVAKIRGQQPSSIDPASYLIVGSTIINDIAIDVVLAGDDEDYIFADVGEDSTPDYNVLEDELIDIGS
jgi:Ca2+-binding RTX toxin-like protein